jgi:hypothetical protein
VSVCKKGLVYLKTVPALIKTVYQRLIGNGYYKVAFTNAGRKWYCDVPGFLKELFEHTLMVGGASKFLDYYSRGKIKLRQRLRLPMKWMIDTFAVQDCTRIVQLLQVVHSTKTQVEILFEEIWLVL